MLTNVSAELELPSVDFPHCACGLQDVSSDSDDDSLLQATANMRLVLTPTPTGVGANHRHGKLYVVYLTPWNKRTIYGFAVVHTYPPFQLGQVSQQVLY